jgi:outer membrane protein assembly factor BamB
MDFMLFDVTPSPAVVPVLVGPIQTLLAVLPGILLAAGAALVTMFRPSSVKKLAQILWSQKLVVVPTVAAVGAVAYFWGDIFPPGGGGKREHTTDTWMVSRGGPARLGFNESDAAEPGHGDVNWRHDTFEGGIQANQNVFSSPAVVGNRVYFTTMEANDGRVMCIDADSGELVWQFANDGLTTQGYRATFSSPVVAGDRLVVGEGLHTTRDARVFCLDLAASDKSGKGVKLWEYRTASHVESTPAIVDGKVYVGAGDDGFYCFDLEGDGNGNAKELWHAKGEKYLDCESSPLVIDGKVYFSLGEGGKAVVCLDAETGEELWRTQVDYPAFGSPAIVDGKLVVGMGIGNYVFSAEEVLGGRKKPLLERLHKEGESEELKRQIEALEEEIRPAGAVWCLDVENGEVLWKFGAEQGLTRTVLGSPSIRDGKVYFGSRDKNVYCLSLETGEELHRFNARAPVVGGLSVGEDTLYAVTQTGQVWGLDRKTFEPVWAMELGSDSISSPAVARGRLYVGSSTGGGLVCAGSPGRIAPPPIWKGPGGGVGESGWDGRDLPTDLKYGWQWPARGGEEKAPLVTAPALLEQSGRIVLPARKDGKIGVECIDVEDEEKGEIQKPDADTQPVWFVATANELSVSPVATVDAVFFVDGKAGDEGRALRAVAPDDGSVLWQREVGTGAAGWLSLTPGC